MNAPASVATGGIIHINDQPRALNGAGSLAAIVVELGMADRRGVAVAVNGNVVPRAAWPAHQLRDGDRILVIRATQGG